MTYQEEIIWLFKSGDFFRKNVIDLNHENIIFKQSKLQQKLFITQTQFQKQTFGNFRPIDKITTDLYQ